MTEIKVNQVWTPKGFGSSKPITVAAVEGEELWIRFADGSHLTFSKKDLEIGYKLKMPFFEKSKTYTSVWSNSGTVYAVAELMEVDQPERDMSPLWALLKWTKPDGTQGYLTKNLIHFPDFRETK